MEGKGVWTQRGKERVGRTERQRGPMFTTICRMGSEERVGRIERSTALCSLPSVEWAVRGAQLSAPWWPRCDWGQVGGRAGGGDTGTRITDSRYFNSNDTPIKSKINYKLHRKDYKDYKRFRIDAKQKRSNQFDRPFLPAIPDPGSSHRVHAFYRLVFVHWCYNLKVKIRLSTNGSLSGILIFLLWGHL